MATWQEFESAAPELAAAVLARFEATKHHVLGTLRADGSPRLSGTEVRVTDGELTTGSMSGALKARDLQRDGRCAIHANPGDGSMEGGDAKVAGVAVEVFGGDEGGSGEDASHAFRIELSEVVLTSVENGENLLIQVWKPGAPVRDIRRK
jgi:hypothetical protein